MTKSILAALLLIIISFAMNAQEDEKPLAFPGADGFGKYATGGRGGRIIEVTNLDDEGEGSFRQAVTTRGSRIVVFKVSGTIHLAKALTINAPNLTIAGQSSPGEGICISGGPVSFHANNVVVRFMRFRPGDLDNIHQNGITAIGYSNIIFDHCSFSWSSGYNISFYNNAAFTMQWCIISESLYKPKVSKVRQGYGAIIGGMDASFHHNIFAHNAQYNPNFAGAAHHQTTRAKEIVDFRNNVIYNWVLTSAYGGEGGNINMVANYFRSGPATPTSRRSTILTIKDGGHFYLKDNFIYSNTNKSKDNWKGVEATLKEIQEAKADKEFPFVIEKTQSAEDAYVEMMSKAGASFKRDDVDARIIQSVGTGSALYGGSFGAKMGIIDSQQTVGGWATLKPGILPEDSDKDQIPDDWEKDNGLNPNDPSDALKNILDEHYDNLEVYLNDLVKSIIK